MLRRIPAYVDGAINIVDVADVAAGHLLADELGVPGERYILGNRNYTLDRLFADLARLSGVEAPAVKLPVAAALALAEALGRMPGPTPVTPVEIRSAAHWWTYRSTKARRELGWSTRPHEETVEATVAWYREREGRPARSARARASRSAGASPATRRGGSASSCRDRAPAPLPHADELAVPVRPRGARAQARARSRPRRCGSRCARATATRSTR